jgi:PelA/Pel-15E family pectate lyase
MKLVAFYIARCASFITMVLVAALPAAAVLLASPFIATAQQAPRIEPGPFADNAGHWYAIFNKENIVNPLPGRPRYMPTELAAIAGNILLFQKTNGGWPKNYDVFAILTPAQKDSVAAAKNATNTTFDNGSTYNQIAALATAWYALKDRSAADVGRYRAAAVRGLEFILRAQYKNGGWPQYYPLRTDYSRYITFNDGAYEGIMRLLKAIGDREPQYDFVEEKLRGKLAAAYRRGLDCIFRLQINDAGAPTAWCQQYDEVTLQPAWARKFEPPSICNKESADLVLFLMTIDHPNARVVAAVCDAVGWFKASRIYNTRIKTIPAKRMVTPFRVSTSDRLAVTDPAAPPIWTRYYELETHRPMFCNRDSKVVYSLAQVLRERRDGYGWYTYSPQKVIDEFPAWYAKWSGVKTMIVAADGSGDYRSVQAAFDACTSYSTIFIRPGVYREKLVLGAGKDHITLIGDDAASTVLTYDDHPGMVAPDGDSIYTRNSYSVRIDAGDVTVRDITIRNDAGFTAGQAVGLEARGDRLIFEHCRIVGNQDILFLNNENSRQYYRDCYIEGTTDFIFGSATAWFEHCHIHSKKNSHVTAASTPGDHRYGFIFDSCTLTGDSGLNRVSLGRPWRPYACVIYLHCWLGRHILPGGWANWNKTENYRTARYSEYDSQGPGADPTARVSWSHQLTAVEASKITLSTVFGNWKILPLQLN